MVEFLENILPFSLKQDLVYSHQSLAEERLLYPWPRLKGSYKIESVCSPFRLLVSWLISFFLKLSLMLGAIYSCVWETWIFWKKSPLEKNGKKWPKNMVFELFKKVSSLVLSSIHGSLTSCENRMLGKNLVLKLKTKKALGQWDFSIL